MFYRHPLQFGTISFNAYKNIVVENSGVLARRARVCVPLENNCLGPQNREIDILIIIILLSTIKK